MKAVYRWCLIPASMLLAWATLWVSYVAAGGGHGTYFFAKVFFPYTMLSTHLFDEITTPFLAVAVLQFPLYGALLAFASNETSFRRLLIVIGAAHAIAVMLCFVIPIG